MEWYEELGVTRAEFDLLCAVEADHTSFDDAALLAYGEIAFRLKLVGSVYNGVYGLFFDAYVKPGVPFTKQELKPLKDRAKAICK